MTVEEEIEQVLSGPEPDTTEPPKQPLSPEDREAMYLLRRLGRLRAERLRIEQLYTDLLDELEMRRVGQVGPIEQTIEWIEQRLALWHHARLQEDPKALTVNLPTGTLTSSAAQPRWTYDDAKAFLEWATKHATAAIRTPDPKPDEIDKNGAKAALADKIEIVDGRAVVKDTGEKIPGLRIDPGGDYDLGRFYRTDTK